MESLQLIEMLSPCDFVFYMKVKGMLVVAARDIVGITHTVVMEDGTMGVFIYSVEIEGYETLEDKVIRADMLIGGWHFEPIDAQSTKVYNFAINDYKGSIPKFVLNSGASMQGIVFKNLIDHMNKDHAAGKLEGKKEFYEKYGFNLVNGYHEDHPNAKL